ncbi:MAG: acyl-CoA thioesterase [Dysgonamonadaceae bacterium]|jgi:acyl-CoA thioester hydrolase|nr:acyl-CoA thioesterase [Dysgonamonadaceae bacterium]
MKRKTKNPALTHRTECKIRFSEVDMMGIAWHGNYLKYLEDGREDFGKRYGGIGYMDIYRSGYKAPIVDLKIEYKKTMKTGEALIVETRYIPTEAAKIHFDYIIYNSEGEIVLTAYTIQVFLDQNDQLVLQNPNFYTEWKQRWKII